MARQNISNGNGRASSFSNGSTTNGNSSNGNKVYTTNGSSSSSSLSDPSKTDRRTSSSVIVAAFVTAVALLSLLLGAGKNSMVAQTLCGSGSSSSSSSSKSSGESVPHRPPFNYTTNRDREQRMFKSCVMPIPPPALSMTLDAFIDIVVKGLNQVTVGDKPFNYTLDNFDKVWHDHGAVQGGFWAEFGVFQGRTLKLAHDKITKSKSSDAVAVFAGFDSFEGLPADWRGPFDKGYFATNFEKVRASLPPAIELYQGWFQDTIGQFLEKHPTVPAAFIHHDSDLFVSTSITFSYLARRIVPGTIMCFDQLIGYEGYRDHEVLALMMFAKEYHAAICPIATNRAFAPEDLVGTTSDEKLGKLREWRPNPEQSACFQVLSIGK